MPASPSEPAPPPHAARNGGARPATIEDVARLANVSRQTVSRVLNAKGEISPATRARVEQVIAELDYRPNPMARSLITRTTYSLGLVMPDIGSPFFPEIARGAKDLAHGAGYQVLLVHTDEDPAQEVAALHQFRAQRVDGVMVVNSRLSDVDLARALDGLRPVVLTNRSLPGGYGSVTWPGYREGGRLATEHLLQRGHRRIGYVDGLPPTRAGRDRLEGYRTALAAAGVSFDRTLVEVGAVSPRGGALAARALLAQRDPPTAVFAYNDLMAFGVLRACHEAGCRVPEDVAVVGFGGTALAEVAVPSLTTIPVPLYEIGRAAAEALLAMLRGSEAPMQSVDIAPTLVVRESSGGPGAGRVRDGASHRPLLSSAQIAAFQEERQ